MQGVRSEDMKKRLFTTVVLMLAIMSGLAVMPFAADVDIDADTLYDIEFYVEEAVADFGDTKIDVGIDIKRNPGLAGVSYELEFDGSAITVSKPPVLGVLSGIEDDAFNGFDDSHHLGVLSTRDGSSIMGNGKLLTYTFNINPEADAGTYPITIKLSGTSSAGTELGVLDDKQNSLTPVIYNGSITIPGYTVSFDVNGGEGEFDDIIKTYGKVVTLPAAEPTKDGYDFLGWSVSKTAAQAQFESGSAFDIDADTTLYAIWKKQPLPADTLELTLNAGEISEADKTVIVTIGATQNPGFNGLCFYLDYDKTRLEYVTAEAATSKLITVPPATDEDKFQVAQMLGENYTATGAVVNITFKVKDDAPLGDAYVNIEPIKDECSYNDGTGNVERKTSVNNTAVTIGAPQLLGDINLDGTVDIDDAILLFQHSMMSDDYQIGYVGNIDFTNDGNLDIDDAILLFQYSMMPDDYPIS